MRRAARLLRGAGQAARGSCVSEVQEAVKLFDIRASRLLSTQTQSLIGGCYSAHLARVTGEIAGHVGNMVVSTRPRRAKGASLQVLCARQMLFCLLASLQAASAPSPWTLCSRATSEFQSYCFSLIKLCLKSSISPMGKRTNFIRWGSLSRRTACRASY